MSGMMDTPPRRRDGWTMFTIVALGLAAGAALGTDVGAVLANRLNPVVQPAPAVQQVTESDQRDRLERALHDAGLELTMTEEQGKILLEGLYGEESR